MENKIKLVGAGNIGSRYLEGLAKYEGSLEIDVSDINKNSLNLVEQNFFEKNLNKNKHKVLFDNNDRKKNYDLIIIATSSKERSKIIAKYKSDFEIKFWLIEKVLEQSSENVNNILSFLYNNEKNIAWVNTPRRIMNFYAKLKKKINNSIPQRIYLNGGLWGMACNAIHFIDMVEWLTDQKIISVDTTNVDSEWIKSKRKGFYEITGELNIKYSKGTQLILRSDPLIKDYIINIEMNDKDCWQINEKKGIMKNSNGDNIFGNLDYISDTTHDIIKNILNFNSCGLTNIKDSCRQHNIFLDALLDHWNKHNNKKDTTVPIT